ncbi:hypothetical protein FB565_005230 [Actinoplanes lutulentus]|uniref:Uncharacterized protein n=1 Tax=Actinoplanes lutulentus TaxID=1287878 RepID=A0A327ZNE6_9ACTN|nr:hypothetical protein [Actinoplanes lutulentus]MBB2945497.1 hypothetical protein [Actinoplanes lutulentus]RAK40371.1 hypothetical protein B0I29_103404 [Actinoplanes lutulentus]
MSFELFVWHEPAPISADAAEAKVREGIFRSHPAVPKLRDELLRHFPPQGVWAATPEESDSLLALSCVWSRAGEFGDAVRTLAARHGLVCYEPGTRLLDPNAPAHGAR